MDKKEIDISPIQMDYKPEQRLDRLFDSWNNFDYTIADIITYKKMEMIVLEINYILKNFPELLDYASKKEHKKYNFGPTLKIK